MRDYIGEWCAKYLNRKSRVKQEEKKKIEDKKLEEVVARLRSLAEFIKFLNTQAFKNRHERKAFWRDVQDGKPVVEDTLKRILERYGVKEETMEELEKRKAEKVEAEKVAQVRRQKQEAEQRKVKDLAYIKNGICVNRGEDVCNLGYACDGCPYNRTTIATKKQVVESEKKDESTK